jgi:SAM-dependent methyltransferase
MARLAGRVPSLAPEHLDHVRAALTQVVDDLLLSRARIVPGDRLATLFDLAIVNRRRDPADRTGGMGSAGGGELGRLLDEQVMYYRSLAPDYLNRGLDLPGGDELAEALEAFRPAGSVLELACGPGLWTSQILRHATDVTAVDASPEMLAIAAARVNDSRARFVQADLFSWVPGRRYDVVFMGFWLSHVPLERFASFWAMIADCLNEEGRVFFMDDAYRTPDELVEGPSSATIRRRLADGTSYHIVKVPHRPQDLEQRLTKLGWRIKVTATSGPFYWGAGTRA